eukprot:8067994-Ditylum_brightwellii.AAC.1
MSAASAGLISNMTGSVTAAAAQLVALSMPPSSSKKKKNAASVQYDGGSWVVWNGNGLDKGQQGKNDLL